MSCARRLSPHGVPQLAAIFIVRPLAAGVALLGFHRSPLRDRAAISFYGVRGIGTLSYLSYALEEAEFTGKEQLWAWQASSCCCRSSCTG